MLHAGQPGGGDGHRHGDVYAYHGRPMAALFDVDGHALAEFQALEIRFVGPIGAFRPRARVGIVVEHSGHAPHGQAAKVLDAGDGG